jgi:hypothetical protein
MCYSICEDVIYNWYFYNRVNIKRRKKGCSVFQREAFTAMTYTAQQREREKEGGTETQIETNRRRHKDTEAH